MGLQKYQLKVVYKKGREMYIADILGRAYLPLPNHVLQNELAAHPISRRSRYNSPYLKTNYNQAEPQFILFGTMRGLFSEITKISEINKITSQSNLSTRKQVGREGKEKIINNIGTTINVSTSEYKME